MIDLVIFDFDGVVIDSELISNGVLAEVATELGHPMSVTDAVDFFGGTTLDQQVAKLEGLAARSLGAGFGPSLRQRTLDALEKVRPISGVESFLAWLGNTPVCIGSTSALERIQHCLKVTGLTERFGGHVFSVAMVQRNKPAPDIFLHAAKAMGARPERTIVIEDSPHGVRAGVDAGMAVIGLAAASHLKDAHANRLRAAGAHEVAMNYDDIRLYVERMM